VALFAAPPPQVMKELRPLFKANEAFGLVLFRLDTVLPENKPDLVLMLRPLCPDASHLSAVDRDEVFLFLPGADDPDRVREEVAGIQQRLKENEQVSVSAAVAFYPQLDYSRGAIPLNCRKGLLHAAFFAPMGLAVFDSVTLNISGDRYYAEGDLGRAVREYRQGLRLASSSVKLLNSLGVALAEMGRKTEAREMFERAAEGGPADFRSRYNLALFDVANGESDSAIERLRECLAIEPENSEAVLQLAALYLSEQGFREALALLDEGRHPLFNDSGGNGFAVRDHLVRGVLYRYLAQAYKGLGRIGEAVSAAEKAVACNPVSARAAALLGGLYLKGGEGLGPALAMCRKAVALDRALPAAWLALGRVLLAAEEFHEAEEALRKCRRLAPADPEPCLLLAEILEKLDRPRDAASLKARAAKLGPAGV